MEVIKVVALRDFAIQHLPRAQKVSTATPADQYQRSLFGIAVLVSPTAPAVQQAAAQLLRTALTLLIGPDDGGKLTAEQNRAIEQRMALDATELCMLTGDVIPWLPTLSAPPETALPASPTPTQPQVPATPPIPILQAGETQTTETAARYLGIATQTMRAWASEESGPIVPVRQGRRLGWPTAELTRLKREGWKPKSRNKTKKQ